MSTIENEMCRQQRTGSCRGCPVLNELLYEVKGVAISRPRQVYSEAEGIALEVARRSCPTGVTPQTSELKITSYGRATMGGGVVMVDLKGYGRR